jgi:hypothetical protein
MTARCVGEFVDLAERTLADPSGNELSDDDLAEVMTAATKLYAARAEDRGEYPPPVDAKKVSATEIATIASEMVRAVDLNMFDLSMWHGRPRGRS